MSQKLLMPCIYLYQQKAVTGLNDKTVVNMNPVELARYYSDQQADALLIFDLSNGDVEHEEALDIMKAVCETVAIPVIGAGNVKRMEDVKKILYAGCKKAVLNFSKESNIAILEEVSKKFGKDKIIVSIAAETEIVNHRVEIEQYAAEILLINENRIRETLELANLPVLMSMPDVSLDKIMEAFGRENVYGITGKAMNDNAQEFVNIKQLCKENGLEVHTLEASLKWSDFKKNSDGHVTVVVQDDKTDEVLMVAYMNEEAYNMTVKTGRMTYYSRSRDELWIKGETSGHYQYVKSLTADCDLDTILARVTQMGAACHTGSHSCFFNSIMKQEEEQETNPLKVFEDVMNVIKDRKVHPKEGSYTNYLFDKGIDKILKKLGEESTEIVIAAKNPNPNEITYEICDFLYHMMVLMVEKGVTWEEITEELAKR